MFIVIKIYMYSLLKSVPYIFLIFIIHLNKYSFIFKHQNRKNQLIVIIDNLRRDVKSLWCKLKEKNVIQSLIDSPIYDEDLRLKLLKEKDRCLKLRRSKLDELVVDVRKRIQ
jgi:hypothetical protein